MLKKIIILTGLLCLSLSLNAALLDRGTYTTDTVSNLDWLDITFTQNQSYSYVASQLGVGGMYEGWSIASRSQFIGLLNNTAAMLPYNPDVNINNDIASTYGQYNPLDLWRSYGLCFCEDLGSKPGWQITRR